MQDPRLAVHRTIVVVDVEGFGDRRRTNRDQVAIRDGLYRAMRDAFGRAGISWDDCGHEDRGDGLFVLVPAEVPKGLLAEALPSALVTALRTHNGAHPDLERIRLRMALHAGEVQYDEHGVTAAAVNLAFRLLDAGALKAALASSPGVLAVIASSWFYEEVVRHSAAVSAYRPVEVVVKETTTTGWICLPDHTDTASWAMLDRLPAVVAMPGGPPAVALRTLPRDTAAFTGRTRELDRLVAAVRETATAGGVIGIHAVDGMAGIGKTAFAVHAAHQLAARFPDGQIFLRLHAHTAGQRPVDPAEALATLLLSTGVAPQQILPGLEARSACWRGHLAGKKVLVVLDDAASSDQVRPLLPGAAGCLVLVTSRRRLIALEEAAPISLGTLPPGEAAGLFARLAGRPSLQPADADVAEVTGLCGCLPLAIRLVAAGLRHHPAWTVTGLAAELATARDRLAAMQAEDVSVAAAFDLSYQDLTAGQRRLFRRLGLHPGADFDAYGAAALDDTGLRAARQGLEELYDTTWSANLPEAGTASMTCCANTPGLALPPTTPRTTRPRSGACLTTTCTPPWPPAGTLPGATPSPALRHRPPSRFAPRKCVRRKRPSPGSRPNAPTCTPVPATAQPTGILSTPSGFPLRSAASCTSTATGTNLPPSAGPPWRLRAQPATGPAKPGPSTTWAWCSGGPGTTRPPPPA
jgi:NB-ARC domain